MNKGEVPNLEAKLLNEVRQAWSTARVLAQAYLGQIQNELPKLGKRWTDWLTGNGLWAANEISINSKGRDIRPITVLANGHLAFINSVDVEKFIFGINRVEGLSLQQASAYLEIPEPDFRECLDSIGRGIVFIDNGNLVLDKDAWRNWGLRRRWADKKGKEYQDKLFRGLGRIITEDVLGSQNDRTDSAPVKGKKINKGDNGRSFKRSDVRGISTEGPLSDSEIIRRLENGDTIGGETIA